MSETRTLAEFVVGLKLADIPPNVIDDAKRLFIDWLGSALAGRDSRQVGILEAWAAAMGPSSDNSGNASEILPSRKTSTPYFAALINAAASHVVEQDDVHNGSVFHPGTVIFPPLLAAAQAEGASGADLLLAVIAGYEAGIRIGEFLGRSHYRVFHTTGTAGTLAAAIAVAKLYRLDVDQTVHALGSAGTQAAGLWEFLRDAADSKQLHTAKAAADGLMSAWIARAGFTGAQRILDGVQGMAAGMSSDAKPAKLIDRLGQRWAITETSYKWHASCRHTHPAADALQQLMHNESILPGEIKAVTARVHQAAIDVLGPVTNPATIHQAKFSMGTVLALIAVHGQAGLMEFERHALSDAEVIALRGRVAMVLDEEVNTAYPARWIGKVEVTTMDGHRHSARVDVPKGDPGNTLSRSELEDKAVFLAGFRAAASAAEMRALIKRIWRIEEESRIGFLLPM